MLDWMFIQLRMFLAVIAVCVVAWVVGTIAYHTVVSSKYRCFDTSNTPPQSLPEDGNLNIN